MTNVRRAHDAHWLAWRRLAGLWRRSTARMLQQYLNCNCFFLKKNCFMKRDTLYDRRTSRVMPLTPPTSTNSSAISFSADISEAEHSSATFLAAWLDANRSESTPASTNDVIGSKSYNDVPSYAQVPEEKSTPTYDDIPPVKLYLLCLIDMYLNLCCQICCSLLMIVQRRRQTLLLATVIIEYRQKHNRSTTCVPRLDTILFLTTMMRREEHRRIQNRTKRSTIVVFF